MLEDPLEIPSHRLSEEALLGILDDYIHREGTDYGEHEWSLGQKRQQLREQLRRGEVAICYDPATDSCTLLAKK